MNFIICGKFTKKIKKMNKYPKIILKQGKEAAVKRFHPWIFSGAIAFIQGDVREGDPVEVFSHQNEFLAMGHFAGSSIAVKLFSFQQAELNDAFWLNKLRQAYQLRKNTGLVSNTSSNAYRLVFSEGDGMPGLIIDWYNGVAVIQTHSMGMHRLKPVFVIALREIYGHELIAVYDKSSETMHPTPTPCLPGRQASLKGKGSMIIQDEYLFGTSLKGDILETGHRFRVDWEQGQKTGFFLDQKGNRMYAQYYAKDRKVLNSFCYSGAFSVYSMKGGAKMVHSVDSSRQAIGWTLENAELNGINPDQHQTIVADVKKYLAETDERYDMIILDPPAFAKTHKVTNNALHAYIHINARAMQLLKKEGILFTFSCSQAISRDTFQSAIMSAALEAGREVKILHRLSQGQDHPVSIYHPEGEYLKGLILFVK